MLIADIIANELFKDRIAVRYKDMTIHYKQLNEKAESLSQNILSGYEGFIGNNVGLLLENSIDYIVSFFSILKMKKIIVPLSAVTKEAELVRIIQYSDLKLILTDRRHVPYLYNALEKSTGIGIYLVDEQDFIYLHKDHESPDKEEAFQSTPKYNENSVALMMHTSGTFSHPKRVMLTNKNLLSNAASIIQSLGLNESDVGLIPTPLYLATANIQMISHLYLGAAIILMNEVFITRIVSKLIKKYAVTNMSIVPYIVNKMTEPSGLVYAADMASLRVISVVSAPFSKDLAQCFMNLYPSARLVNGYGLTEASPRVTHFFVNEYPDKIGSVGQTIPGVEIKIINDQSENCGFYEIGEVAVQGDNVMKGYYKNDDATREALRNGWLHTGDMGYLDPDGFLFITGRKKNIIISCGVNIYPEEIEELLLRHEAVAEAYVYGITDTVYGEKILADVVLKQPYYDMNDLLYFCKKHLENYKIPSQIRAVESISKTENGKKIRGNVPF